VKILVLRKLISYTEDRVKLVSFSNEPGSLPGEAIRLTQAGGLPRDITQLYKSP
jgi:hypothetical protein